MKASSPRRSRLERIAVWLFYTGIFGVVTFILGCLAVVKWNFNISRSSFHLFAVGAVTIITYCGGMILGGYARRRGRAEAARHDFKLCTKCRYPLNTLPEQGQCPECGTRYEFVLIRPLWLKAYETITDLKHGPPSSRT